MKTVILVFFLMCSIMPDTSAQIQKHKEIAKTIITAFNLREYSALKKEFVFIGKIMPLKRIMNKEFEPYYNLGKAELDSIYWTSKYSMRISMKFPEHPGEKQLLVVNLNSRNKIEGFGIRMPDFIFAKNSQDFKLNNDQKINLYDSIVKVHAEKNFNGSVLVVEDGNTIYKNHNGLSNFELNIPLNDSSIFELASLTKQFTAMAVMILEKDGKLKLTDTLTKFFPELLYKNVSIENLLTHSSGLADYMSLYNKKGDKSKVAGNNDVLKLLIENKPKQYFNAGEMFMYSNTGYMLLSLIIEHCSGMKYEDYVKEKIFIPAGMKDSRIYNTRRKNKEFLDNYAFGYVYSKEQKKYILPDSSANHKYVYYLDGITGDGAINSTINDLILWDKALRENKFIPAEKMEKIFTPYATKYDNPVYGYGVFLAGGGNYEKIAWHTGGWPGYHNIILRFLERNKTIVILSNNEYPGFMKMAYQIAELQ